MLFKRKLKTIILSMICGGVSLVQFASPSEAFKYYAGKKDAGELNSAGITCYLVGNTEIKPPTITQLIISKDYLEKKFAKGRITKEVYDSRLTAIGKQLELLIDSLPTRCKNLAQTEDSIEELKLLYEHNYVDKAYYDLNYEILNKKMVSLKTARIKRSYESKYKSLDIRYEQKLFDAKTYNLRKEILVQEEQYCVRHLLYSFHHLELSKLNELESTGQINGTLYLRKKLKLLKSLNASDERKQRKKDA